MNTTRRTSLPTALLSLVAMPLLVQTTAAQAADPEMDACISAYLSSYVPKEQPVKVRRVETVDSPMFVQSSSPIHLTVTSKSGKHNAKAVCVVTGKDVVLTLEGKPATHHLAQADAKLSSR